MKFMGPDMSEQAAAEEARLMALGANYGRSSGLDRETGKPYVVVYTRDPRAVQDDNIRMELKGKAQGEMRGI